MIFLVMLMASSMLGFSAARPEPTVNAGQWATAISASSLQGLTESIIGSSHNDKVPFTLLTKFIIRPSIAKEFVSGWLKFREVHEKAEGSRVINLSKPLTDNLLFYSYEEWDSKKDFFEFVKKDSAAKKLTHYIEEHDIPIIITQLVPAVPYNKPGHHHHHHHDHDHHHHDDHEHHHHAFSNVASQVAGMSWEALGELIDDAQDMMLAKQSVNEVQSLSENTRKHKVIILTKFLVKPSRIEEFVKAADEVTEEVSEHEKGNVVYGLSKPINDDVTFWSYAVWDDEKALKSHLESSYVKKFLRYVLEHDIYTKAEPLFPVEQIDE